METKIKIKILLENQEMSEGFIIRRHSVDNYEVWCEKLKKILFLCKEEFEELK